MDLKNLTHKQKILVILLMCICIAVYFLFTKKGFTTKTGKELTSEVGSSVTSLDKNLQKSEKLYLEITGQVKSPGVYEVEKQVMVIELISLAGGLTDSADLYTLHKDISLASLVENRAKVYIPGTFERSSGNTQTKSVANGKVSINNASTSELESLPNIGSATATKIISARPFHSLEDLKKVQGIGEKTYDKLIALIEL